MQKCNKAPLISQEGFSSTQSRGRTGTALRPQVFETSASTDSAIWACHHSEKNIISFRNGLQMYSNSL
jgi:hypothetical protein